MKKLLLTLPLVAGVSWAGTSYYTGAQAQAAYTRMLDQLNAIGQDVFVLESTEYNAGIMESSAITEIRSAEGSKKNIRLSLNHQINHALINVAHENSSFGAVNIITTLIVDESYSADNKEILKSFETGQPFVATTEVSVDGATTSQIKINAINYSKDDNYYKSKDAVVNITTTPSGSVTGNASASHFLFNSDEHKKGELSDLSTQFNLTKLESKENSSEHQYNLNYEATLGEVSLMSSDEENVTFSNLSSNLNVGKLETGNAASPIFYALHPKQLNLEKLDFQNLAYETNMGEVDIVESGEKRGKMTDMGISVSIAKSQSDGTPSPIYYDISAESTTGQMDIFESGEKNGNFSNMFLKFNIDKFGNGKKLSPPFDDVKFENLKFDGFNFETNMDEMNIVDNKTLIESADTSMKINIKRSRNPQSVSTFLFDANLAAQMGKIKVAMDDYLIAAIDGARYALTQDLSSDEPFTSFSAGVDAIEIPAVPLKSFDSEISLTGFSTKDLLANNSFFDELKNADKPEKLILSEKGAELARGTLKPDTKLAIKLDAKSIDGNGDATADVWFAGNGSDDGYTGMLTVGDFAKSFAGTASVDIDKAAIMQTPLSAMLDHPLAKTYLIITEDKIKLDANLESLILKINEQIIPLDLMAGEALNRPLKDILDNL